MSAVEKKYNKCSAVAEMGDRLATIDKCRRGRAAVPLSGELGLHLTQCGQGVLGLGQGQDADIRHLQNENDAITVTVIILTTCRIAIYFDVYASVCCSSAGCYNYYTTGNNNRSVLYTRTLLLSTNVIVSYIKSEITQRHIYKPLCC